MSYYDDINQELFKKFRLLCNIVRQDRAPQLKVDLGRIEHIINEKLPDTVKKNAPPDYYELYMDFKNEYEKFRDFILYDRLIGKSIVALGGGFSSGKSSFLNALNGEPALPEDIDPTTSVPTYIVNGSEYEVQGINIFDKKVNIELNEIKQISHGFGDIYDDDDEKVDIGGDITLGHILESIFLSTPKQIYENIAFLDTPGYSKPDDKNHTARTDEQIARGQLNSANFIIWFVQADAGTITEEDIKFIKTLRDDIPKLIVLTKADKKPKEDIDSIVSKIKDTLEIKGIRYVDVFAFSSREEGFDGDKIREQISKWNKKISETNFAKNFKVIFARCRDFYDDAIEDEGRELQRLNSSYTDLGAEDIDPKITEPIKIIINGTRKNIEGLKEIRKSIKELQDEFFTEIKIVADRVGIDMPEPSDIDLIKDNASDPIVIFEEYTKKNGIKTDKALVDMLMETFEDIKPVFNKQAGGSEYASALSGIIKANCILSPDEIRFDVNLYAEEYRNFINIIKSEKNRLIEEYKRIISEI